MIFGAMPLTVEEPDPQPHLGRVWVLLVAAVLVFAGMAARLWVLQVVRYVDYESLASHNRVRHEPAEAPRGGIFDCHGKLLAGSRQAYRIAILDLADSRQPLAPSGRDVADLGPADGATLAHLPQPKLDVQLQELRLLLGLTNDDIAAIKAELADPMRAKFTPVTVRDDVDVNVLTAVEERLWKLPSVVIEKVPVRNYPEGPVTSHVVGYVGTISPEELKVRRDLQDRELAALQQRIDTAQRELTDAQLPQLRKLIDELGIRQRLRADTDTVTGKNGLEAQYESELQGDPGLRSWQVNARNEPVKLLSTTQGQPGHSLVLNLDVAMQREAAARLNGRRGSAVVIDCRDGAVLTLYSAPSYDPALFVPKIKSEDWTRILNDEAKPLQNRAIRSVYPPGSTFKMITASAGLENGVITDGFGVSCPGGLRVGSMFKRCWGVHGGVDLNRAFAVSCDTFFYTVGIRLGPDPLLAMAGAYGVGKPTGIDLPNELGGRLPSVAWHQKRQHRDWYPGDTANISIGQGDIACTALQMAEFTATVANGGTVYRPQLLRSVLSRDGEVIRPWKPEVLRRVPVQQENLQKIRHGMRLAVTEGTAKLASLPNIEVAGKTGSAEDPPHNLPHAWFVCFAPYDNPQIACAVMVENAGHGGENSAPIAKALMELYFQSKGMTP